MGGAMTLSRRPMILAVLAAGLLAAAPRVTAQEMALAIPDGETLYPPTRERLEAIESQAASAGWSAQVLPLRAAAVGAYTHDRFVAADAWFHVYRWAGLFSEPENVFVQGWINAILANHLNYEGVAGQYNPTARLIGLNVSPELQDWLLSDEGFSEEFFSNVKAVDHIPNALTILNTLYRRDPAKFARYPSLALAIALVYDVPPPPWWPHFQVSPEALPRKLSKPEDTF